MVFVPKTHAKTVIRYSIITLSDAQAINRSPLWGYKPAGAIKIVILYSIISLNDAQGYKQVAPLGL